MLPSRLAVAPVTVPVTVLAVVLVTVLAATVGPAAGAETREVIVKPREPRPDVFFLAGRVRPAYQKKAAILQRRNCGDCVWYAFDRFRTDGDSRFRRPIPDLKPGERKVCYRVKVPASGGYARSFSEVSCIGPIQDAVRGRPVFRGAVVA